MCIPMIWRSRKYQTKNKGNCTKDSKHKPWSSIPPNTLFHFLLHTLFVIGFNLCCSTELISLKLILFFEWNWPWWILILKGIGFLPFVVFAFLATNWINRCRHVTSYVFKKFILILVYILLLCYMKDLHVNIFTFTIIRGFLSIQCPSWCFILFCYENFSTISHWLLHHINHFD